MVKEVALGTTKERMVIIEDCAASKAVTVFIRGGNKMMIDETKRSLHDAICVARNLVRSNNIAVRRMVPRNRVRYRQSKRKLTRLRASSNMPCERSLMLLDAVPTALAENSGLPPIETVADIKAQQLKEKNPVLGVDCKEVGTNDMKSQGVFETLIGKQQQILLATQVVKLILKIDDVILAEKR